MAIHVRRKKHTTPRFKPDMWGRVPADQGTVLYDGSVTMTLEGEEPYQYLSGTVSFDDTVEAFKWTTLYFDDGVYSNMATEDDGTIYANFYTEDNDAFASVYDTGEIQSDEPMMSAGDHAVKIVQEEPTFSTIFSGNVTLVADSSDASATLDLSEYPADCNVVSVTLDDAEIGRGIWYGTAGDGAASFKFSDDGQIITVEISSSESDTIRFVNGYALAGTHNIVIKASEEVYNPG